MCMDGTDPGLHATACSATVSRCATRKRTRAPTHPTSSAPTVCSATVSRSATREQTLAPTRPTSSATTRRPARRTSATRASTTASSPPITAPATTRTSAPTTSAIRRTRAPTPRPGARSRRTRRIHLLSATPTSPAAPVVSGVTIQTSCRAARRPGHRGLRRSGHGHHGVRGARLGQRGDLRQGAGPAVPPAGSSADVPGAQLPFNEPPVDMAVAPGINDDNDCTGQTAGGQDLGALFAVCDHAAETKATPGSAPASLASTASTTVVLRSRPTRASGLAPAANARSTVSSAGSTRATARRMCAMRGPARSVETPARSTPIAPARRNVSSSRRRTATSGTCVRRKVSSASSRQAAPIRPSAKARTRARALTRIWTAQTRTADPSETGVRHPLVVRLSSAMIEGRLRAPLLFPTLYHFGAEAGCSRHSLAGMIVRHQGTR